MKMIFLAVYSKAVILLLLIHRLLLRPLCVPIGFAMGPFVVWFLVSFLV